MKGLENQSFLADEGVEMRGILQLFVKSPITALKEHMTKSAECVELVRPMFEALTNGDEEKLAAISKDISKIEHRADEIKNEIRDSLPRNIFLPVNRVDLLRVLSRQDSIPDTVENIAILLAVRRTYVSPDWRAPLLSFVNKCVNTFRATCEIYNMLEVLFDVGPTEAGAEDILVKINAIGQLEWEADKAQFGMLRIMFEMEDDLKSIDIIWWSKILREVGDLANYSEKTADRIRLMLYKK